MSVPPIVHRVKLVVASHGPTIGAVLAVVGLVAFAGAAWTVTHPPTVEVTDQLATHTVDTDVTTSTVVTGNSSLWERGRTLTNRPVYPLESAPRLTVRVNTSVPPGDEVQVSQELTLVYRAEKDGTVFWQSERRLVAEDRTVVDGAATTTSTVDVRQVRDNLDEINQEITGLGRAQASLRLNVSYATDTYSGTVSKTAPLTILSSGYWVGGTLDAENTHQTPQTREVTQPPDTAKAVGLGLLGFLSWGGAGSVVYAYSRRLDPVAIREELSRGRYREWVSAGRLGQFVAGQDVAMDSLKDLVDVAIDSNNRAVYDRTRNLYAVVANGVVYYYDPHHDLPEPDIDYDFDEGIEVSLELDGGHTSAFTRPHGPGEPSHGPSSWPGFGGSQPDEAEAELPTDAVAVERSISLEDGRIVVAYRLVNREPEPVTVDVAAFGLAADLVESARPTVWDEPSDTFGVDGGVGFTELVGPSGEAVVKYVVSTSGPPTDEDLEALRSATPPKVRRVLAMGRRSDH